MSGEDERHSKAVDPELISDPDERAAREARNGLRQFDAVLEMVDFFLQPDHPFKLRISHILHLHRAALEDISAFAGNFRPAAIEIKGSKHKPVDAWQVPEKLEELCDYINDHWTTASPIHLATYAMWRLNWIHPFTDGNGRTARALSYFVLCVRLGYRLPGTNTIPEQISRDKAPYYKALEAADQCCEQGSINSSVLEDYLSSLLAHQLIVVHKEATQTKPSTTEKRIFH